MCLIMCISLSYVEQFTKKKIWATKGSLCDDIEEPHVIRVCECGQPLHYFVGASTLEIKYDFFHVSLF